MSTVIPIVHQYFLKTSNLYNQSGSIVGSVIGGGDFLQGAAQGLVVYFANHLAHELEKPEIVLKYNTDGHPDYGAPDGTKNLNSALKTAKKIFAKNGYRLTIKKVSGVQGHDLAKNEAFLNIVGNGDFPGNSKLNGYNQLDQYMSYVTTSDNGIFTFSNYEIGYTIAHETWHQIYNKAQFAYNGFLIHDGTNGYPAWGGHDNTVNSLNRAASYDSENILQYQKNIVNYYLNDIWAK